MLADQLYATIISAFENQESVENSLWLPNLPLRTIFFCGGGGSYKAQLYILGTQIAIFFVFFAAYKTG